MHQLFDSSSKTNSRLRDAIAHFPRSRILVAGDLMLDTFIWGNVNRISPEAPVPVVEVHEETRLLGGTANVVHNVSSLGGQVTVTGAIGDDSAGRELASLLASTGVDTDGLIIEAGRPTTLKTRIIAHNQQVVRFDRELRNPLSSRSSSLMIRYIESRLENLDAIVISDYAKGVVTIEFMDALRSITEGTKVPLLVDPKVQNTDLYRRVTMITPNHLEAERMSGVDIVDDDTLAAAGRRLLEKLECETVLITRGKEGMSLFLRDGGVTQIPTVARRVFDVTGAGDTVIAAVALGVSAGLSVIEAALLANLAAGIVVGEVGTAAVSSAQLLAVLDGN